MSGWLPRGVSALPTPMTTRLRKWGRVVNYAKRHGLEPQGKRIEKAGFGARGLKMRLVEGPHPKSRSQRPKGDASVARPPRD